MLTLIDRSSHEVYTFQAPKVTELKKQQVTKMQVGLHHTLSHELPLSTGSPSLPRALTEVSARVLTTALWGRLYRPQTRVREIGAQRGAVSCFQHPLSSSAAA